MPKRKAEQLPLTFIGDESPVPILSSPHRHPSWIKTSPSELLTFARMLDLKQNNQALPMQKEDLENRVLATTAGTVMHRAAQLTELWANCRPRSHGRSDSQSEYHKRLDELQSLLPTTKPTETRRIRTILDKPQFALSKDHHGSAQTECLEILARSIIDHATDNPPLTDSYPLDLKLADNGNAPFLDPDKLNKKWKILLPNLAKKIVSAQNWQLSHHPIGAEMSKPIRGFIFGLTEVGMALTFSDLQLTLIKRADNLTRTEIEGAVTIQETDLKSSVHVHVPEPGSHEEEMLKSIIHLTTLAMVEAHTFEQDKPGYSLIGHSTVSVWNPGTIQPQDQVSLKVVALGGEEPEIIDLATKYADVLSDPIVAAGTILGAEHILNLLRKQKGIPAISEESEILPALFY